MRMIIGCILGLAGLIAACAPAISSPGGDAVRPDARPVVIAHRGASGTLPEHTIEAYALAIEQGADFIEPDLVMTADGVLVIRHDRYLSTTTDIADHPDFASRKTRKRVGLGMREDWFVEDFTLAELKTLKARQPREDRPLEYDGQFDIPTFAEFLAFAVSANAGRDRKVGIYPELKDPSFFEAEGFDPVGALLEALDDAGMAGADIPVFIQCFETPPLRRLAGESDWPLVQLLPATSGSVGPGEIAAFADGIGPWKGLMDMHEGGPAGYVREAHAKGLSVHPYTYRDDDVAGGFASGADELAAAFESGVDGVFTDFPATAVSVRDRLYEEAR